MNQDRRAPTHAVIQAVGYAIAAIVSLAALTLAFAVIASGLGLAE